MNGVKYVTISDLNRYIKMKFDTDLHLNKVYLKGEISNFKNHSSGHLYFTLKDETSRIAAIMFRSSATSLKFIPEDGMKVLVTGRISLYEAQGTYQIYVDSMEQDGLGNLYLEFERLKKKLQSEGLFNSEHKKKIPKYPLKIGIITAPTGAAIRDILSTIKRRYPICETILFPALVQGTGSKESIIKAINKAQEYPLDVIICGRGGGSLEDLWSFNEEEVARAIYNCNIPIISGVGHEIDFTIADFVADLRAPTPTGAAEMAVPNLSDLKTLIKQYEIRAHQNITDKIHKIKIKLDDLLSSYVLKNPLALYEIKAQALDALQERLIKAINNKLNKDKLRYESIIKRDILKHPEKLLIKPKNNYQMLINKLKLLNPLNILDKGYSIVKKDNILIKDIQNIKVNDIINITLAHGKIDAKVEGVIK